MGSSSSKGGIPRETSIKVNKRVIPSNALIDWCDLQDEKMKLAPPSVLLAEITVAEALEPYLNDRIQHSERSLVGARTMNNQAVEMYKQSNKDAKRLLAQGISAIEVGDMVESDMLHSHDAAEEVKNEEINLGEFKQLQSQNLSLKTHMNENYVRQNKILLREEQISEHFLGMVSDSPAEKVLEDDLEQVAQLLVDIVYSRENWMNCVHSIHLLERQLHSISETLTELQQKLHEFHADGELKKQLIDLLHEVRGRALMCYFDLGKARYLLPGVELPTLGDMEVHVLDELITTLAQNYYVEDALQADIDSSDALNLNAQVSLLWAANVVNDMILPEEKKIREKYADLSLKLRDERARMLMEAMTQKLGLASDDLLPGYERYKLVEQNTNVENCFESEDMQHAEDFVAERIKVVQPALQALEAKIEGAHADQRSEIHAAIENTIGMAAKTQVPSHDDLFGEANYDITAQNLVAEKDYNDAKAANLISDAKSRANDSKQERLKARLAKRASKQKQEMKPARNIMKKRSFKMLVTKTTQVMTLTALVNSEKKRTNKRKNTMMDVAHSRP